MSANTWTCRWRRALTGAFLLLSLAFLQAAVVVPALHQVWHGDHDCDQPDCVVLVMAQGGIANESAPEYVQPPEFAALPAVMVPALLSHGVADCPLLPGRSPPV